MKQYVYKPKPPLIPITESGFYSLANVMAITGWSRATLYRKMKQGLFPKPDSPVQSFKCYWKISTVKEALGL